MIAALSPADLEFNSIRLDLENARALNDKLQALLNSARHENEGLRARECNCEPDLETVTLTQLLGAVRMYLDEGQSVGITHSGDVIIHALGRRFMPSMDQVNETLDAAAVLARVKQ